MTTAPVFGVVGWKNSGKTTLMTNLIRELTARGYGSFSSPRNALLKGTMPAFVKSSVGSSSGMREALGTRS